MSGCVGRAALPHFLGHWISFPTLQAWWWSKLVLACYGLCLEGVSSFVWRHISSNLSLGVWLFRSAFAHQLLMAWVLITYIKDAEVEQGRKGRRSTRKQDLLPLFFFLILVDYFSVAFIFWRCSMASLHSLSFVRCIMKLFFPFLSCFDMCFLYFLFRLI